MRTKYSEIGIFVAVLTAAAVAFGADPIPCENELGQCEYTSGSETSASCVCQNGLEETLEGGAPVPVDADEQDIAGYCLRVLDTVCDGENPITGTVSASCEDEGVACQVVAGFDYLYGDCGCTGGAAQWTMDGAPTFGRVPTQDEMDAVCNGSLNDAALDCPTPSGSDTAQMEGQNTDDQLQSGDTSDTEKGAGLETDNGFPIDDADESPSSNASDKSGCSMSPSARKAPWFKVLTALLF